MLVQLGAARFADDRPDFGYFEQNAFHLAADLVGLFERDARHRRGVDRQRAFVEWGQEAAAQREENGERPGEQDDGRAEYGFLMGEHPFEHAAVDALQKARDDGFLFVAAEYPVAGQQVAAQHGRQRDRHDHRREQRDDERDAQRAQHAPFHAVEEEKRDEGHDRDDRRVDDRRTDLFRRLENDAQRRQPLVLGAREILAQPFEYVLDVDDRVVDERSDRDGHASEAHRVDREPHPFQRQNRHEQRERQRDQRDDRRAEVHQKDQQDDHDEDRSFEQRFLNVVDRAFDETGLTERVGRYVHVRRQRLAQFGDGSVEFFGQFERVRVRLLRDGHQHGRLTAFGCRAQPGRLGSDPHVGHLFERNGEAVLDTDHGSSHFVLVGRREHAPDDVFVAVLVQNSSARVTGQVLDHAEHFARRDAEMFHPGRVQQDLVLLDIAADDGHLGYASGREQPGADRPVGQCPQFFERSAVRGQADNHQLAQNGRLRSERRRPDVVRKRFVQRSQLFGYDLAGQVDVGSPVELDPYDREAGGRARTDATHVGRSVHGRFDREGHGPLDFFGRHAARLGHHDDRRRVQVRENVHFHFAGRVRACDEQHDARDHYQHPVA